MIIPVYIKSPSKLEKEKEKKKKQKTKTSGDSDHLSFGECLST